METFTIRHRALPVPQPDELLVLRQAREPIDALTGEPASPESDMLAGG